MNQDNNPEPEYAYPNGKDTWKYQDGKGTLFTAKEASELDSSWSDPPAPKVEKKRKAARQVKAPKAEEILNE